MDFQIVELPVEALTPYEGNARKHADYDVSAIAASIEEFGFCDPIGIWSDDNIIVEGHGRLEAAKQTGMATVPCIRLDFLTDEQRRAYALAHNKTAELSAWDMDALVSELKLISDIDMSEFGFDVSDVHAGIIDPDDVEEDEFDATPPKEPKAKLGDIYQLGSHRLMCGDSANPEHVGALMDGGRASLYLTDPPYNVDYADKNAALNRIDKGKGRNTKPIKNDKHRTDADFIAWLSSVFGCVVPVLAPGAAYYVFTPQGDLMFYFQKCMIDSGLPIEQTLVWIKNNHVLGLRDYHFKHEPILYGYKHDAKHFFTDSRRETSVIEDKASLSKLTKSELVEMLTKYIEDDPVDVIRADKPLKNDLHPTMKPVKLMAHLILNSSQNGDIVLDTFGGSGSTLMACEQLDRRCYTMEIDPGYVDVIIARWEKYTGEKAVLVNEEAKLESEN